MVFATLAFLGAFGADQGLLTYFADLSGPGLPYVQKYVSQHFWALRTEKMTEQLASGYSL